MVASRHVRDAWRAEMNGYRREQKLARESGTAVRDFEQVVLEQLRDVLLTLPPGQTAALGVRP